MAGKLNSACVAALSRGCGLLPIIGLLVSEKPFSLRRYSLPPSLCGDGALEGKASERALNL